MIQTSYSRLLTVCLSLISLLFGVNIAAGADELITPTTVLGTRIYTMPGENGVRAVYIFEDLNDAMLTTSENAYWYDALDTSTPIGGGTFNAFSDLTDGATYIAKTDNGADTIAVFDFKKYRLAGHGIKADNSCEATIIRIDIPAMEYRDTNGAKHAVEREITITYTNLTADSTEAKWNETEITDTISTDNLNKITLEYPLYVPTDIEVHGCDIAKALYDDTDFMLIRRDDIVPIAIGFIPRAYTALRGTEIENENERVIKEDDLSGSAPLNILFRANATPAAEFFLWEIKKSEQTITARTESETRYVFDESGKYKVSLKVHNRAECECTHEFDIDAKESMLAVPNIFTPNGDGVNDEFRVVYRSIATFSILVFDRWQHQIYSSSDPAQGWDGRINGRMATEGAYYYIVEAIGTDGVKYKLKGAVNLLKGKK